MTLPMSRCRLRAAVLGTLILLSLSLPPALAGSEHDHSVDTDVTSSQAERRPTLEAQSEEYELSGTLRDGVLSLHLKRVRDGSAVVSAEIELTVEGETGAAVPRKDGLYEFRSATLKNDAEQEVIIAIREGDTSDLLIGVLHSGRDGIEHDDHGGRDDHDDHSDHGSDGVVKLTPELMREFGVTTERAAPGTITDSIKRPAEISFNLNRYAHVVPRVAGIAKSINASEGDAVKPGQILAVLDSRELAELKEAYLAARERLQLAREDFERIEGLRQQGVVSEKSHQSSRTAYAEARIAMRSAKQKLNSIGVRDQTLDDIAKEPDSVLTQYTLHAPMGGMIVNRHLVQGELVTSDREAFTIADMSSVWVDISLYSYDLQTVRSGQQVTIETETGQIAQGQIAFVSPDVSEQTRTAIARVVLSGASQNFRPGMFVNAEIAIAETEVKLRVPNSALQVLDGEEVVFVLEGEEFRPTPIVVGKRNGRFVEVVSGLERSEEYAASGAFTIKAQLSKANFDDGHNH